MGVWLYHKEEFKEILNRHGDEEDEFGSVKATKEELLPFLKGEECFFALPHKVLKQLENATTLHSLNRALELIYDYADEKRIWLGL